MKKLAMAYFEEAKWLYNNYIPTPDEYMKVSLESAGYMMASTTSLVGMRDQVSQKDFDWITKEPLIVRASSVVGRLMDDLVGDEVCRVYIYVCVVYKLNQKFLIGCVKHVCARFSA